MGGDRGGCGGSWEESLRWVGDPVDVVTGAETHLETDFRLPGAAVAFMWVRTYDTRNARTDRGLGFGFRFLFDVELRHDVDGMTFSDGRGVEIAFPFLTRAGESSLRRGYILECAGRQHYRVHRPGNAPSFELLFPEGTHEAARLAGLVDKDGRAVRFNYDAAGLTAVDVGAPGRLLVERSGARMTAVVLAGKDGQRQHMARYGYDPRGFLVEVENAYGHVRRFEYDGAGRMSRQIDRRGYSFHYTYDGEGRCVRSRGEDGVVDYQFDYRPTERLTVVTRADGAVWRYFYDDEGSIIQTVDPYGALTAYLKDERGRVVKEVDPNGNESEILHDPFGMAYAKRDPLGHARLLPIDPSPHPLAHTLPTTPAEWEVGRLARGRSDTPAPNLDAIVPPWARGTVEFPLNRALARPRTEQDVQGRCLQEVADDGKVRKIGYGPNSYESWNSDFEGRTTRYDYTSWNHLTRIERPGKRVTDMTYTIGEQIASATDPGGNRSDYRYDLKDRMIEVRRNGRIRERYRYDAADNLIEKLDGDDRPLLKLVMGPGNRVKQRVLASGDIRDYERDRQGYIVGAKNESGACAFAYEGGLRVRDERDGRGVRHRLSGWRVLETTVLGRFGIQYLYPEAGVTLVRDPGDQVQRLRRVGPGLVERACSNDVRELVQYDPQGRCVLKAAEGGSLEGGWGRRFVYSSDGDLIRRFDSQRGATAYEHDEAHRLARVAWPDGAVDTYAYDLADNLLQAPGLVAGMRPGNRLAAANGDHFEYDRRDHIAWRAGPRGEVRYTYDSRDQLVAVDAPGLSYRARHDAFGRRTEKNVNGNVWTFYWDSDRLAAEILPDGHTRIYVYADSLALVPILFVAYDAPDADPASGKQYHVYTDHLGCPELVLDDRGRTVWRARIQPYGTAVIEVGADFHQPLRWPGHYHDVQTGLHENRYRSYSPELGRYLQSDPAGIAGGLNLYAYTDNPLRSVDLDGLNKVCPDDKKKGPEEEEGGPDKEGTEGKPKLSKEEAEALCRAKTREHLEETNRQVADGELSSRKAGPVVAGVVDQETGRFFPGRNDPKGKPPENLHPLLADRLANINPEEGHSSPPGAHAEVHALNDALNAREASGKPVKESDLGSFTQQSLWRQGSSDEPGGMKTGNDAPRCGNCQQMTSGVNNLSGDAPPNSPPRTSPTS